MNEGNDASVVDLLQQVADSAQRRTDQVLQERLGIGLAQYKIMALLLREPLPNQRAIADVLGQTEASISRQIKLLASRGLAIVKIDPFERRRRAPVLTAKGVRLTRAAQELLIHQQQTLFASLSNKQQTQLQTLLATMYGAT